jgi:Tol biopolymer transport system component
VSIDGGQPTRLTNVSAFWPWISPDSKWIGCEYLTDGSKSQLAIIPIDGGTPAKLFDVPPRANFRYGVRWMPDGKSVTYRDWDKGIWRQAIDGGPLQQIPNLPAEKIYSYGWSRDGKLFAFTRGTEIRDAVLISNSK